jgi:hypothetical protein
VHVWRVHAAGPDLGSWRTWIGLSEHLWWSLVSVVWIVAFLRRRIWWKVVRSAVMASWWVVLDRWEEHFRVSVHLALTFVDVLFPREGSSFLRVRSGCGLGAHESAIVVAMS